jgi:ABC-type cobalt transport system substrate-binding protein
MKKLITLNLTAIMVLLVTFGMASAATYGTSGNVTARINQGGGNYADWNQPGPGSATVDYSSLLGSSQASASASIASGSLHAFASATGDNVASASAGFSDTLTFYAPSSGSLPGTVTYTLHVSGSVTGNGCIQSGTCTPGDSYWSGSISAVTPNMMSIGGKSLQYGTNIHPGPSDFDVVYTLMLNATPTDSNGNHYAILSFALTLFANSDGVGYGRTLDFSHTAYVEQELPAGWTFTSASGEFLKAPIQDQVPEPSAMLLLGLGLAGLAGVRRRFTK